MTPSTQPGRHSGPPHSADSAASCVCAADHHMSDPHTSSWTSVALLLVRSAQLDLRVPAAPTLRNYIVWRDVLLGSRSIMYGISSSCMMKSADAAALRQDVCRVATLLATLALAQSMHAFGHVCSACHECFVTSVTSLAQADRIEMITPAGQPDIMDVSEFAPQHNIHKL